MHNTRAIVGLEDDIFAWLVNSILPVGGHFLMLDFEAYFDESGTHEGAHVLCVAGYVIEREEVRKFIKEWNKELHRYNLPYFRMSECAHRSGAFKDMQAEECIELEKRLIKIIKRRTVMGLGVTVNASELEALMPKHLVVSSAYAFCSQGVLTGVGKLIDNNPSIERVAYFFESGCAEQPQTNALLNTLFTREDMRKSYRYVAHSFIKKTDSAVLQAADLLAWQCYSDKREGKPQRKDFSSLLEHPHYTAHLDKGKLEAIQKQFEGIPD